MRFFLAFLWYYQHLLFCMRMVGFLGEERKVFLCRGAVYKFVSFTAEFEVGGF